MWIAILNPALHSKPLFHILERYSHANCMIIILKNNKKKKLKKNDNNTYIQNHYFVFFKGTVMSIKKLLINDR